MPFRLGPERAKIQFTTSAEMPSLIYRACLTTGIVSNTVYCQYALVDALARDLAVDPADLIAALPPPRGPAAHLYAPGPRPPVYPRSIVLDHSGGVVRPGQANTDENVR